MPSTTRNKVNYSPMEKVVLGVLRDADALDTLAITTKVYKKLGVVPPYNARTSIVGCLRSLQRKGKHNHESWKLTNTIRSGPHQMTWRLTG